MTQTHPHKASPGAAKFRLKAGDLAFLAVLVLALVGVVLSGRFAYREGSLLEAAKGNALALSHWIETVATVGDKDGPLPLALCAAPADGLAAAAEAHPSSPDAKPVSWAACREVLFGSGGPFYGLSNPFVASNYVTGDKCERKVPSARGLVVLEKGISSPPGLPPGVFWGPLADEEPMVRGLMLRVVVCDGGGYPIRLSELKL